MKLTPTMRKVFAWIIASRATDYDAKLYRSALARRLWPGRSSGNVNAYAKCAGSLLGKYHRMGLLSGNDYLTQKAKDLLAGDKAP